jgi:hypothetical protein
VVYQVSQLAAQGGGVLRFQRDFNSSFGDPAPGVPKQLQITYLANGMQQQQNFAEGQWNQVQIVLGGGGGGQSFYSSIASINLHRAASYSISHFSPHDSTSPYPSMHPQVFPL